MKKKVYFFILMSLLVACKQQPKSQEFLKTVKTDTVKVWGSSEAVSFTGKVRAASNINLAFRISGVITKINAHEGDFVRKGDVLAEMDSRDYALQFAATEAEYQQIKEQAERVIRLYEKGSVTQSDYDKATSGLKQITAKYNAHKNALNDTKLLAPIDAYIQKLYFTHNETIAAGMPVFALISKGIPEVEAQLPASIALHSSDFQSFSCEMDAYPHKIFPLDFIAITHEANLNQLYTLRLKFRTSEERNLPSPGLSATVNIHLKGLDSTQLFVPFAAIFEKEGKTMLWKYDSVTQQVSAILIVIHEVIENGVALISGNIQAGDVIITAGIHVLQEGERVKPLPAVSETNVGGML